MNHNFKPGDKVICIKESIYHMSDKLHGIYTIDAIYDDRIRLKETNETVYLDRFESVHIKKFKNKLETLINE